MNRSSWLALLITLTTAIGVAVDQVRGIDHLVANPPGECRLGEARTNIGGDVVHIPRRPGEPDVTHADITRITQDLGWAPTIPFEEGVARALGVHGADELEVVSADEFSFTCDDPSVPSDETNLVVCFLAGLFGAERRIARVRNTALSETLARLGYDRFHINELINPELVAAHAIRKIVEAEDARRPLSDSAIGKLLNEKGLQIARRTVAKYREELKIPSSSNRKQLFQ